MSSTQPYRLIHLVAFVALHFPHAIQGLNNASGASVDVEKASRCYKSWESAANRVTTDEWRRCFPSKTLSPSDFETFTATSILRTIQRTGPGSTYKEDCDGIPRFQFSPGASITTTSSLIAVVHRGSVLGNWTTQCTIPPTTESLCDVPQAFCDDLWTSYTSRLRTFSETEPFQTVPGRPVSPCGARGECLLDFEEEIVLLFWPPRVVSRNICASDEHGLGKTISVASSSVVVTTITEISFHGEATHRLSWISGTATQTWDDPVVTPSVMTGSWVLTSPNVYLAHRPITAFRAGRQDGGGLLGDISLNQTTETIRTSGIITLQSDDVYSLRPLLFKTNGGVQMARSIANGLWRPEPGQLVADETLYETKSFNFGDLEDPVPASVYFDAREDCWGEQTHCAIITDSSYRPKLMIKRHVWRSLLSEDYFCDLPSVVDPPIAFSKIEGDDPEGEASLPLIVPAHTTPTSPPREDHRGYGLEAQAAMPQSVPRPFWGQNIRPTATARPGRGGASDLRDESQVSNDHRAQGGTGLGQLAANDALFGGSTRTNAGGRGQSAAVQVKNGQNSRFCSPQGYLLSVLVAVSIHVLQWNTEAL